MNVSSTLEVCRPARETLFESRVGPFFRRHWFPVLWVFIGLVSAYDAYLVEEFQDCILNLEQNPVGHYLLKVGGGDVSIFVRVKAAGTLIVLTAMAGIYHRNRRLAFPITMTLAAFQLALLLYMTCSLPLNQGDLITVVGHGLETEWLDVVDL